MPFALDKPLSFVLTQRGSLFPGNSCPCYDWPMRALITGGTGRIGRATGACLESKGWSVRSAGGSEGDLPRPAEARALVERAVSDLGGLDLLVNAASEGFAPKSVLELTERDWDLAFGAT